MPVSGEYPGAESSEERGIKEMRDNKIEAKVILLAAIILIGAPIVIPPQDCKLLSSVIFGCRIDCSIWWWIAGTIAILISGIFTLVVCNPSTCLRRRRRIGGGIGLLFTAVGLLGSMAVLWVILKVVPFLLQGAVNICRKIAERSEKMKKGWKAGWIIAGVAAVTGGMFCIAGVALGGRTDTIEFLTESMFSTSFQGTV